MSKMPENPFIGKFAGRTLEEMADVEGISFKIVAAVLAEVIAGHPNEFRRDASKRVPLETLLKAFQFIENDHEARASLVRRKEWLRLRRIPPIK